MEAELLDDLSGFEFEDLMEDVFRNLGYENVRQAERTADEGRDVLMEEVVDGVRRAVVVECKHTDAVGRPVVQKLHSAVATFEYDGPKRGIVVTTGTFSGPAREYADQLRRADDPHPIELVDGTDLRDIAEEIGLDLYNGRIEILCDETLRPVDPASSVDAPVREAFRDVDNLDATDLPRPDAHVEFQPVLSITARTDATFETSVGVIHRVDETILFVVRASRERPEVTDEAVGELVVENRRRTVELDEDRFADRFDEVTVQRFGQTETEYKEWAVGRVRDYHTTDVVYTGDNNVTYRKTCRPNQSDVSVRAITPVYLPRVRMTTRMGEYEYPYEYHAAGPSRVTTEDGVHQCVQCSKEGTDRTYTYCENCGSINCARHVETERLEGTPVCTGCAVTERFALSRKYFYDEENLEAFREEYRAMPVRKKAMENTPLVAGSAVLVLIAAVGTLVSLGVV